MSFKWDRIEIVADSGEIAPAIAPVIVSASRSTDLPAFHWKWFYHRLRKGHVVWVNPFNQARQFVSFSKTRVFVFWTKNPLFFMKHLEELDERGLNYYFHYTLNDYEAEGLEPGLPPLEKRLDTFKQLAEIIGREKVIWRFDPIIALDGLNTNVLLDRVNRIGNEIKNYTEKLVFSFADIDEYRKVAANLKRAGITYTKFDEGLINHLASGIGQIARDLGLSVSSCAEGADLSKYGISHSKCVDDDLMVRMFSHDEQLMGFLGRGPQTTSIMPSMEGASVYGALKDKGQRKECGCIVSKDIGQYSTCGHLCRYCYANTAEPTIRKNLAAAKGYLGEAILPPKDFKTISLS